MRVARPLVCIAALLTIPAIAPAAPQTDGADEAAIRTTALDYIEGWYTADAERMARAVHPELVKRIIRVDPDTGETSIVETTAEELVEQTRRGGGSHTPEADRRMDVEILDVYGNAATVKVTAGDWIDYLHIARFGDDYRILHVLWELTPEAKERARSRQQ